MRFSIIVPVYNVEDYLDTCLKSILAQSFTDYEVIVVNDGSTDSSKKICEYYTHKYSHIKLIDKINGGLSDARNYGINNANGEYLIFLDSDDFWNYDFALEEINRIINRNKEIDLIIFGHTQFDDGEVNIKETVFPTLQIKGGKFESHVDYLIEKEIYKATACDKVIKRSILVDNQIYFPINKIHEDVAWCFDIISLIGNYYIFPKNFYYYRKKRKGSITSNTTKKSIMDLTDILFERAENIQSHSVKNKFLFIWGYSVIITNLQILSDDKYLFKVFRMKFLLDFIPKNLTLKHKAKFTIYKYINISYANKLEYSLRKWIDKI